MALYGTFIVNDADYSPLSFPGVGTFLAFSGNDAYRNHGGCVKIPENGPIPTGKYWIVPRPEGGLYSRMQASARDTYNSVVSGATFKHNEWFALYRNDWNIDDYTWIESVKRGNFRLHPGHISKGCITLPHDSDFAMLRNALLRTPQVAVPCAKSLMAYGTIQVIAHGTSCP